jgi:hypothetical protein
VTPYEKPDRVNPDAYENALPPEVERLNVYAKRLCCMIPAMPPEAVADLDSANAVCDYIAENAGEHAEALVRKYLGDTTPVVKAVFGFESPDAALQAVGEAACALVRHAEDDPGLDLTGRLVMRHGFLHRRDIQFPRQTTGGDSL